MSLTVAVPSVVAKPDIVACSGSLESGCFALLVNHKRVARICKTMLKQDGWLRLATDPHGLLVQPVQGKDVPIYSRDRMSLKLEPVLQRNVFDRTQTILRNLWQQAERQLTSN